MDEEAGGPQDTRTHKKIGKHTHTLHTHTPPYRANDWLKCFLEPKLYKLIAVEWCWRGICILVNM